MLTFHILAAVAEHEREMISKPTKDGLAAGKAKGVRLGNSNLAKANRDAVLDRAEALRSTFAELAGMSAHKAADALNSRNGMTPTGRPLSAKTVLRVRERHDKIRY